MNCHRDVHLMALARSKDSMEQDYLMMIIVAVARVQ